MKPTSWSWPLNLLKVPSGVKVAAQASPSPESIAWLYVAYSCSMST
jgi:hypothetical protein